MPEYDSAVESGGGGASRTTDPAAGTSSATDVSLRELIASWRHDDRGRERERFGWFVAMGAIVWFFIERHLADLNHENARILKQQESTVSADTYAANEQQRDKEAEQLRDWRKEVDAALQSTVNRDEFQRDNKTDRRATSSNAWTWIGGAIGVIGFAVAMTAIAIGIFHSQQPTIVPLPETVTITTGGTP